MAKPSHKLALRRRPRRLRASEGIRRLIEEHLLTANDLIAPVFCKEDGLRQEIESMPGVFRHKPEDACRFALELHERGVRAVALFPCIPEGKKDAQGTAALDPNGLIPQVIREIKGRAPGLLVIADVALDPYTSHGHDGLWNPENGEIENDATVRLLCEMARILGEAGVDLVAPSDMMDGRIGAIRASLDDASLERVGVLAYAVKFASAFYGPFRDAIGSRRGKGYLDKRTYQLSPTNLREGLLEAQLDEEEGADILMVKPAGPYLDVISQVRARTLLPLAAYQVSGEYAQIVAAARNGWLDLEAAYRESLIAIKRAGADMIITYFASRFVGNAE
ncbi:porphobilinogen synthase [Methylacidimicrobium tartarophylax]|uniref:Delta-aminolevulinic acid dehydratase n=1 Tax=Methylacidimicrobium tartarophylax TaxID=1041768 RepID=A0A5E6MGC7_9BACT|nr:porphobilinogen synthase [Methylacidimicrobium tartarophylax]VVM07411.1 porphobilinogen synthase [Methylacidimicrobium tartarophylax]